MSRKSLIIAAAAMLAAGPAGAHAQGVRPHPMRMGPGGNAAEFLLSRSAQLDLSDDQVLRLAELSRQAVEIREELRAELEAVRPTAPPQTDAEREVLRAALREVRDEYLARSDQQRDAALAVLTAEQRAEARELLARNRGRNAPAAMAPRDDRQRRPMRGRPMPPRGDRQPAQSPSQPL